MHKQPTTVHKSSCIELYYQCGLQNTQSNMLLELTAQAMEEQCFNILRTQEQLGLSAITAEGWRERVDVLTVLDEVW